MQCGVTPITPARPGKVHELWEDWSQRPLETGRRRHSQVGWRGGWEEEGREEWALGRSRAARLQPSAEVSWQLVGVSAGKLR